MQTHSPFRSAVRAFYAWIGSTVVLGAAPIVAVNLLERGTLLARGTAVLVGVSGVVPWLWVLFTIIRRGDEFVRRTYLVAFAFAFAGTLILLIAVHWLVRADFVSPPDLMILWIASLVLWLVALLGTKHYFERER